MSEIMQNLGVFDGVAFILISAGVTGFLSTVFSKRF